MTKAELIEENTKLRSYLEKILEATTKEGIKKQMKELDIEDYGTAHYAAVGKIKALATIALEKG